MIGEFKVLKGGKILTFTNYDDILQEVDNVISFKPDWPEPPHTEEEHEIMSVYNDKLQELMKREQK